MQRRDGRIRIERRREPALREPRLVREQLDGLLHQAVDVRLRTAIARLADELKEAARDLLAAERLFLDEGQVRRKVGQLRTVV